jgi:hypothetical protein
VLTVQRNGTFARKLRRDQRRNGLLPAGYSGHNGYHGSCRDGRVKAFQEPDVFLAHEDVHKSPQVARVVEETFGKTRVNGVETLKSISYGRAFDLDLAGSIGQRPELGGDADSNAHLGVLQIVAKGVITGRAKRWAGGPANGSVDGSNGVTASLPG